MKGEFFMRNNLKRGIVISVLLLLPLSLSAQEFGTWSRQSKTDRFGDPTGEYAYVQPIMGEGTNSIGNKSSQVVVITYSSASGDNVIIGLKDTGIFSMPLNWLLMGPEPITLYVKDSVSRTHSFSGFQISSDGGMVTAGIPNNANLIALLKKSGSYKAVIEGERWSCSFSFNGGMPE
jgi:hypothetical protein